MPSPPDLPAPRRGGPSPATTASVGVAAAAVLVFAGVALFGLESCTPGADSPRPIEAVPTVESQPQPQPQPPPPSDYAPPPPDHDPGPPNGTGFAPPPPPPPDPPPDPPEPRRPPRPRPPDHPPPVT